MGTTMSPACPFVPRGEEGIASLQVVENRVPIHRHPSRCDVRQLGHHLAFGRCLLRSSVEFRHGLLTEVAPRRHPLFVLLQENRPDQAQGRLGIGEDAEPRRFVARSSAVAAPRDWSSESGASAPAGNACTSARRRPPPAGAPPPSESAAAGYRLPARAAPGPAWRRAARSWCG